MAFQGNFQRSSRCLEAIVTRGQSIESNSIAIALPQQSPEKRILRIERKKPSYKLRCQHIRMMFNNGGGKFQGIHNQFYRMMVTLCICQSLFVVFQNRLNGHCGQLGVKPLKIEEDHIVKLIKSSTLDQMVRHFIKLSQVVSQNNTFTCGGIKASRSRSVLFYSFVNKVQGLIRNLITTYMVVCVCDSNVTVRQ